MCLRGQNHVILSRAFSFVICGALCFVISYLRKSIDFVFMPMRFIDWMILDVMIMIYPILVIGMCHVIVFLKEGVVLYLYKYAE